MREQSNKPGHPRLTCWQTTSGSVARLSASAAPALVLEAPVAPTPAGDGAAVWRDVDHGDSAAPAPVNGSAAAAVGLPQEPGADLESGDGAERTAPGPSRRRGQTEAEALILGQYNLYNG